MTLYRRLFTFSAALAACAALAGPARAQHIYLNGVPIDGVRGPLDLDNVKVHFDEKGDLYLEAKGYAVHITPTGPAAAAAPTAEAKPITPPPAPPTATQPAPKEPLPAPTPQPGTIVVGSQPRTTAALTKHYWLAALQKGTKGATQYDVDVYVNGSWVTRVRASDPSFIPVDVTKYVHSGANTVHFSALKNLAGTSRVSESPQDALEIVLGEGSVASGRLTIDAVDADFTRTAAETDPVALDKPFTGR